jgi:hypothetical protein
MAHLLTENLLPRMSFMLAKRFLYKFAHFSHITATWR